MMPECGRILSSPGVAAEQDHNPALVNSINATPTTAARARCRAGCRPVDRMIDVYGYPTVIVLTPDREEIHPHRDHSGDGTIRDRARYGAGG